MSGTCAPLFLFIFFLGFGFPWTLRKRKYLHQNPSRPSRTHHVLLLTDDLANRLICTGTWVFHFLFWVRVLPWTPRKWKYLHQVMSPKNPSRPHTHYDDHLTTVLSLSFSSIIILLLLLRCSNKIIWWWYNVYERGLGNDHRSNE